MDTNRPRDRKAPTKRRILVLGRERAATEATERFLTFCGHQVETAGDPDRALAQARALKPEVLVCDLGPTSSDKRVRVARKIQESHDARIVVVSTYRYMDLRKRFPGLRVSTCLRKPVSLRHLARIVTR